MAFSVLCPDCGQEFISQFSIRTAMEAKRFHMEQRHLQAKVETDT